MRILAFDTATPATVVALCGERTVELRDDPPPGARPRHATQLLGLISEALEQSATDWDAIDRIAVGVGPGTFTGLRIGIATAKALARAAEIPLVGVSTLHSLALNLAPERTLVNQLSMAQPNRQSSFESSGVRAGPAPHHVAAVLDARRGEAFAAVWEAGLLDGPAALGPAAFSPDALATALRAFEPGIAAIGDGALAFREQLEQAGAFIPDDASELHRVTAAAHCVLAKKAPVTPPDDLHPDYQREPDAQPR